MVINLFVLCKTGWKFVKGETGNVRSETEDVVRKNIIKIFIWEDTTIYWLLFCSSVERTFKRKRNE